MRLLPDFMNLRGTAGSMIDLDGAIARRRYVELLGIAAAMTYVPGRQGTGYEKAVVPTNVFRLMRRACCEEIGAMGDGFTLEHDCYLLRFPEGSSVPTHVDPVEAGREHHRINVLLRQASGGDVLVSGERVPLSEGDAYVFRPDVEEHSVTKVIRGLRLVWSVGCLR